jgi:hypothetical protein
MRNSVPDPGAEKTSMWLLTRLCYGTNGGTPTMEKLKYRFPVP